MAWSEPSSGAGRGRIAAVLVLAGGAGRRLGGPKAWLDWNGKPLLLHVLGRLATLSGGETLVAGAPGLALPPGDYTRVDDAMAGLGPLAGLAAGLSAVEKLDPDARVAVSACDCPFVGPELYRFLADLDPDARAVVPWHGDHLHPLNAVWRADAAEACRRALGRAERRLAPVLEELGPRIVQPEEFPAGLDPARALFNLNDRDDLLRARSWPG